MLYCLTIKLIFIFIMKKAFLEQINKIKSHFDKDKEKQNKKKKYNTEALINDLQDASKYALSLEEISKMDYYYKCYQNPEENPIIFVGVVAFHHKKGSIVNTS